MMSRRKAGSFGLYCALLVMLTCAASTASSSSTPGALELSAAAYDVAPRAGALTVTVNRVGGSSGIAVATYSTYGGTAVAGTDFTPSSGTLSWNDGDATPKSFTVPIATRGAGAKSFIVALLSASGAGFGTPIEASVSISAASAALPPGELELSAAAYSVAPSADVLTITVDRVDGSSGVAIATYSTYNGTAVAGTDYTETSGTLTWGDGDATPKSFAVPIAASGAGAKSFTVALLSASGADFGTPIDAPVTITAATPVNAGSSAVSYDAHILVDQFGYRPADPKVAVIRDPQIGFDASSAFAPGGTYQLRRASDGAVFYSASIAPWNAGAVEPSSGDSGWWFDFSAVNTPGTYYVYDVGRNLRSPIFNIGQSAYQDVLKAAVRMYFYERAGFAKTAPYADPCWEDGAAYVGPNQDTQAHDITDPDNPAKVRDLSGGWFDAGDTNKYVPNAGRAVHQLLTAYQENPAVFTDDFNIPESGNGIPDILDEVDWEMQWLQKMQYPDGSVALKVGDTVYTNTSPPTSDLNPRFYVPSCTSATIVAAGIYAHASYVFHNIPGLQAQAAALQVDAINAWNNYQSIPVQQTTCDSGAVLVPGTDLSASIQGQEAVVAAIYLFAITGDAAYDDYVAANYQLLHPYQDVGWIRYEAEQGEALLFYTTLPNANAALVMTILANKLSDTLDGEYLYGFNPNDDLYRNNFVDYYWGSNEIRSNYGNSNEEVLKYGIAVADATPYQTRALETLHYLHGVNPFGMVYLSNMNSYGATSSVNELFGGWFIQGSIWADAITSQCGPAPGYVPGGPNLDAEADGVPATEVPPVGQPAQKSYKDWNGPDDSWVVSEPGIYYQAAYVQLLAAFAQ
jgi:endoglucanase